ncbi:30S ribosomal protein S8 [Patescibacteria group bacterium]|nr:MAG: 30S ribosomal protein S8 [Patescibacteria group bacterium]
MTDPIADLIIRIKNGGGARKESVTLPYSRVKMEICLLLEKEGFVGAVARRGKKTKMIEIGLRYVDNHPRVQGVRRLSRPSRRVYKSVREIVAVKRGYGMLVLSTPKGILSDKEARAARVGGEALFEIW